MSELDQRAELEVKGNATDEEVAALVAVLTAVGSAAPASTGTPRRASEWSAPHRMMRTVHSYGPGGWKASALPR